MRNLISLLFFLVFVSGTFGTLAQQPPPDYTVRGRIIDDLQPATPNPTSYTPVIEASYMKWLGRAPSQGEIDYWAQALASGTTVASMHQGHQTWLQQQELDATIQRSYQAVFRRAADEGELNYWRGYVRSGISWYENMVQGHQDYLAKNPPNNTAPPGISLSKGSDGVPTLVLPSTSASLTAVEPLTQADFTMPIGNNLRGVQSVTANPAVNNIFQIALGRAPSQQEHNAWVKSDMVPNEVGFRRILRDPRAQSLREDLVQRAFRAKFRRNPTTPELQRGQTWIMQRGATYSELLGSLRATSGRQRGDR